MILTKQAADALWEREAFYIDEAAYMLRSRMADLLNLSHDEELQVTRGHLRNAAGVDLATRKAYLGAVSVHNLRELQRIAEHRIRARNHTEALGIEEALNVLEYRGILPENFEYELPDGEVYVAGE